MTLGQTCRSLIWVFAVALPLAWGSMPASAARHCIHTWATPGTYIVSGKFRGSVESANIYLTNDCRVVIPLPGVFTGGRLKRAGHCLRFSFKVQGQKQVFSARWCDGYGVVPWGERAIHVAVKRKPPPGGHWKKRQNFESTFSNGS